MKTLKNKIIKTLSALALVACASNVTAAVKTQDFLNDTNTNYIFMFTDNSNIEFSNISFDANKGFVDWTVESLTPSLAVIAGPETAARDGLFSLTFNYFRRSVSFQWAEVLFDAGTHTYVTQDAGTARYNSRSDRWGGNSSFSAVNAGFVQNYFDNLPPAAVPLPSSVVLMLSAAAFIGFSRRAQSNPAEAI